MLVVQHMTGRGGYPMNLVLTPDLKPFYAATYLPPEGYGNVPGLIDLLPLLSGLWRDKQPEIEANAAEIIRKIAAYISPRAGEPLTHEDLERGADRLGLIFDSAFGGFGPAPKFPLPQNLLFLTRTAFLTNEASPAAIVDKTLTAMMQGGFYDHIGGGFFRYATDPVWMIPCFEKLLSDNALLSLVYLEAYRHTENGMYARIARETLAYILEVLSAPGGAFYAEESDPARAGRPEGSYYLWSEADIKTTLEFEADMFLQSYNIGQAGAFPELGLTLPNLLYQPLDEKKLVFMAGMRARLLAARREREAPLKDTKLLSGANGLMIAALSAAAVILQEDAYLERARRAADFILTHMVDGAGRLAICWSDGQPGAGGASTAADYAYLIWGLLELHQASLEFSRLRDAIRLQETMNALFWDETAGGFFFNRKDGTATDIGLGRAKNFYDTDLPADNSVGALNLLKLSRLTGDKRWQDMLSQQMRAFAQEIRQNPTACAFWLYTSGYIFYPGHQVAILSDPGQPELLDMIWRLRQYQSYDWLQLLITTPAEKKAAEEIVPYLKATSFTGDKASAYIVDRFGPAVQPIQDVESFGFALEQRSILSRSSD
jgi:uncharacterized protein YyaL (SSP411 family)